MNRNNTKYLIIVAGPTASGKTAISIRLAKHFKTDIISADSRQFYKEICIGTAKPSPEEQQGVQHHFIDSLSVFENYSAGRFEEDCLQLLQKLFLEKDIVILTGGSGLYIKAMLEGFDTFPDIPGSIRADLQQAFENRGINYLQQELKVLDPEYYEVVDKNNPQRLMRALEVCIATKKPFSSFHQKRPASVHSRNFIPLKIGLYLDRVVLYQRINQRVDQMVKNGLVAEALEMYAWKHLNALQTVGYQELFDHFDGRRSLEEAIELIKKNTRRYAKRQLTWFRKDTRIKWFSPVDYKEIICYIESFC